MDINDILVFVRVAQAGSFSGAARTLNMPVSTVSRKVAQLEEELGIPLLFRTTRRLKITDVGKEYLRHGQAIAAELEKAKLFATNLQGIPQGTLKITATTDFGNQFLGEIVDGFVQANPRVRVDILLTERVVDLIEEGIDLAIRIGELADSTLLSRKIGSIDMQLYASPNFLKDPTLLRTPRDLAKFECLIFTGGRRDHAKWQLRNQKSVSEVEVSGKVLCNNMAMIREFAVAGRGIALMPHFFCAEEVKAGRLQVLLPEWTLGAGAVHVVYPGSHFQLPRVKAFAEHLSRACEKVHWRYQNS